MKLLTLIILLLQIMSCDSKLEISKGEDFSVTLLPYHSNIQEGSTCKLYFTISSPSTYKYTTYSLTYFQTEGYGTLSLDDGRVLQENMSCILPRKSFTLSYTALSAGDHSISLYFSDSNLNTHTVTVTFKTTQ